LIKVVLYWCFRLDVVVFLSRRDLSAVAEIPNRLDVLEVVVLLIFFLFFLAFVVLGAQVPLSATPSKPKGEHDEMLFIIIHQSFELWFKQVLHEISAVIEIFGKDFVSDIEATRCLHHLTRVVAILRLLVSQFDVLETLTPLDFMTFRDFLYPASGFQSVQFRLLENKLGMDPARRVQYQNAAYHSMLTKDHAEQVVLFFFFKV
jgi:tryptophan 2,3-dioxygenase